MPLSRCTPHPEEQAKPASRRVTMHRGLVVRDGASRLLTMRVSKQFCARGRIALSGVGLRPQGPGGGSKRRSLREEAALNPQDARKSTEKASRYFSREYKQL